MDYVLKRAQNKHKANFNSGGFVTKRSSGRRHPETTIFDLDFADDLALLEGAFDRAQSQLNTTVDEARLVGLEINSKKTEALTNQQHSSPDTDINSHIYLELNGQQIEWVHDFNYLGSCIASSEADIRIRKGQAWGAFWKMKYVFLSKSLRIGLKMKIFKAACLIILLYDCKSWNLNEKLVKSLDSNKLLPHHAEHQASGQNNQRRSLQTSGRRRHSHRSSIKNSADTPTEVRRPLPEEAG